VKHHKLDIIYCNKLKSQGLVLTSPTAY